MHKGHFIKLYLNHLLCFQGNTFDDAYNSNTTLLRYISRWVVAIYDVIDYEKLSEAAHDTDNVLTISIPEVSYPSAQVTLRTCALYHL